MANTTYMVYVVLGSFATLWLLITLFPLLVRAKKYNDDKERRSSDERRKEELHQAQLRCIYNSSNDTGSSNSTPKKPQSTWVKDKPKAKTNYAAKRKENRSSRGESGIVKDFGQANYQWKPKTQLSFFVTLTQGEKEITVWGVGLEKALQIADCKIGDSVSLVRGGKEDVVVKVRCYDDHGKFTHVEHVDTKRQLWKCSIV